ncbi:P-loop NTPase fold protein [Cellulomonas sp. URHB0016]
MTMAPSPRAPGGAGQGAGTIGALLHAHGREATAELDQVMRSGAAAQAVRRDRNASRYLSLNRSTALWAAMQLDPSTRRLLRSSGLDAAAFTSALRLDDVAVAPGATLPTLNEDLHRALDDYLPHVRGRRPIDVGDVVLAILRDVRAHPDEGRLPGRLARHGLDVDRAAAAAERSVGKRSPEPGPSDGPPVRPPGKPRAEPFSEPFVEEPTETFSEPFVEEPTETFSEPFVEVSSEAFSEPFHQPFSEPFPEPFAGASSGAPSSSSEPPAERPPLAPVPAPPPPTDEAPPGEPSEVERWFTPAVLAARARLGPTVPVTAGAIVEQLRITVVGEVDPAQALDVDAGSTQPTDTWLDQILTLYDLDAVASSHHARVDESLTFLGLAVLDRALSAYADRTGLRSRIEDRSALRPRVREETDLLGDGPARRDTLRRKQLARHLALRMRSFARSADRTDNSLLVLLDAPWGAGKSSVFVFLERALRSPAPPGDRDADEPPVEFLVVKINAWREQRVGVQWWTLLNALQRAHVGSRTGRKRFTARVGIAYDRVGARWSSLIVGMVLALGLVVAALVLGADKQNVEMWLKVSGVVIAAVGAVFAALQYVAPSSGRAARSLVARADDPMHEVRELFRRTLRRAGRPVVFLVDDLDRCDAEYVVEFLEAVQTLVRDVLDGPTDGLSDGQADLLTDEQADGLTDGPTGGRAAGARDTRAKRGPSPRICLVVAADGAWIRRSYDTHYETFSATAQPGRPLGYLFLEKLFQLRVRLSAPTASSSADFLAEVLGRAPADADVEQTARPAGPELRARAENPATVDDLGDVAQHLDRLPSADARLVEEQVRSTFNDPEFQQRVAHALEPFAELLDSNPRSIKLFVNHFGILHFLRLNDRVPIRLEPLALWTIVEVRWPLLAEHLRAHPEAVDDPQAAYQLPADVRRLLTRADVRAVVASDRWGPLTADLVRQAAGS